MCSETENVVYIVFSYLLYLAISLGVTIWVAKTLHKSGRVFLLHAFNGDAELADSINRLLVVGFYLINIGYATLSLRTSELVGTPRQAIELVSEKIGAILVVLGLMHFLNLYIFHRMRRRGLEPFQPPPFPPSMRLTAQR
jgi:hypothetical protein